MNNDLKMIFLSEQQCKDLMAFIDDYFAEEVEGKPNALEWAWNMTDIYKKLKEVTANESKSVK